MCLLRVNGSSIYDEMMDNLYNSPQYELQLDLHWQRILEEIRQVQFLQWNHFLEKREKRFKEIF